jgi:hypothetical protein
MRALSVSRGFHCLLVVAGLLAGGAVHAATVNRTILDSGASLALFNPDVAVAADGTLHVCAQGRPSVSVNDQATTDIYYLSYDDGTVRAATKVNAVDAIKDGRCQIAVNALGKVVITWAGNGESMKAVLLDPAATPASLIEVAETVVGANTGGGHHALAIDGNGKAHVVRANTTNMLHVRFLTTTLVADVAEHAIGTTSSSNRQVDPGFGIDSNNRLHILYSANDIDSQGPAAYMMLDDAGVIRIAPTALFDRAGAYAHGTHLSLMVQSPTRIHVVYGDKRDTTTFDNWSEYHTGGTAFYSKLNPSLDDQSGDAATLATILVGDESRIGGFWYGQAFLKSGTVHFLSPTSMEGGDLVHVSVGGSGSPSGARLYTAQVGGLSQSKWYVRGAGNHVVWSETVYSPTLLGITTQLVRAPTSAFGGGGGGGGGMPLGTLAVLAGLALARRLSRRIS